MLVKDNAQVLCVIHGYYLDLLYLEWIPDLFYCWSKQNLLELVGGFTQGIVQFCPVQDTTISNHHICKDYVCFVEGICNSEH